MADEGQKNKDNRTNDDQNERDQTDPVNVIPFDNVVEEEVANVGSWLVDSHLIGVDCQTIEQSWKEKPLLKHERNAPKNHRKDQSVILKVLAVYYQESSVKQAEFLERTRFNRARIARI